MRELNWLFDTDSYKASHFLQYPRGTRYMHSYFESRGGKFPKTVFFGLQYYLKRYLKKPITIDDIKEAHAFFVDHGLPFNHEGWMHILDAHGGRLPVRIRAVPEGSVIPVHNVLFTVESTCEECFWIVGYIETLLVRVWYPTTVATLSHRCKSIISGWMKKTSESEAGIEFKLHDFGSRGVSSQESAAIGGAAHLVNFQGSDTVAGVLMAREYYNIPMAGFSIPAAEHSTITAWGRTGESSAYRNMLARFARPNSLVAVVSDSYDLENAVKNIWGVELRGDVKTSGATVVIRPDSGVPWEVVPDVARWLEEAYGSAQNAKGYKVLNYVRIIQGDGINDQSIDRILHDLAEAGFSADNVAFGMGGGLLQQMNRDTNKFAFKCSNVLVGTEDRDIYKDPHTDHGKKSKRGRLDLVSNSPDGDYQTVTLDPRVGPSRYSAMRVVFENGVLLVDDDFADIRARAWRPE